ncbi:hypothetical protein HAX54_031408 [Datura stramonium]|uniref:Uncharacterized protein n=1 Tax=Datura stramonium TaxID=4076 RepID=A0ABS8VA74_DATST|nr:hypothetical protein [Datura stramonium]
MSMEELKEDDQILFKLKQASSDLKSLLQLSFNVETSLAEIEEKFVGMQENLSIASRRIAPLQSLSIANKAPDTKINRAISPALHLKRRLFLILFKLANPEIASNKRLEKLINALCEIEVDAMRFDGLLDDALLNLQDEYESLLNKMRHRNFMEAESDCGDDQVDVDADMVSIDLGSELEIEVLTRICETLAANDCLDICVLISL